METTTASLKLSHELWQRAQRGASTTATSLQTTGRPPHCQAAPGSRRDNFHQLGASVNQKFHFDDFPQGVLSLFYNYNINKSDAPDLEYNQHLLGLRMGFSF